MQSLRLIPAGPSIKVSLLAVVLCPPAQPSTCLYFRLTGLCPIRCTGQNCEYEGGTIRLSQNRAGQCSQGLCILLCLPVLYQLPEVALLRRQRPGMDVSTRIVVSLQAHHQGGEEKR